MSRIAPTTTTGRVEVHPAGSDWLGIQARITNVYGERCLAAMQRFAEAAKSAGDACIDRPSQAATPFDLWRDASSYWLDFGQRSILFWDTLRQRGNKKEDERQEQARQSAKRSLGHGRLLFERKNQGKRAGHASQPRPGTHQRTSTCTRPTVSRGPTARAVMR